MTCEAASGRFFWNVPFARRTSGQHAHAMFYYLLKKHQKTLCMKTLHSHAK
jgi:hypothetical protein